MIGSDNKRFGSVFGSSTKSQNADYVPISLKQVVITGGDSIVDYAFYNCANLENISLPSNEVYIGVGAFEGCAGLTSITIPSGAVTIKSNTFAGCTSLESVSLPSTITDIGLSAFEGCTSLAKIVIPTSVTYVGANAFKDCVNLTIYCPGGVINSLFWNSNWNSSGCPIIWSEEQ